MRETDEIGMDVQHGSLGDGLSENRVRTLAQILVVAPEKAKDVALELERLCDIALDSPAGRGPDYWHRCHAGRDKECSWEHCIQARDGEPARTGRHCPLDQRE